MEKFSLINVSADFDLKFEEGDVIEFEMPSFCSGEYQAVVKKDEEYGLYIEDGEEYFEACRDFTVTRDGKEI